MFNKRIDTYQLIFLILSSIVITACFFYGKNPYSLNIFNPNENLLIENLIAKNDIARILLIICNILCFVFSIFILDEKINNSKNLKFIILSSLLFTPFLSSLSNISFIGIITLLTTKFITSESNKKFIYLSLLTLINSNFIFLFLFIFFDKNKISYFLAGFVIFMASYLSLFNYENIFFLNRSFSFINNISLTSFMAYIYKLFYTKDYIEYINHITLNSYALFIFLFALSVILDLQIYKKTSITDKHKIVLKMLYIPLILSAPKFALFTNVSYAILLFIAADYLYKEKLLCNACVYGLIFFLFLTNLFPILSIHKSYQISVISNFMILFWISAIKLRIYTKLK